MFLRIDNFLTPAEVQRIAEIARHAEFVDGKVSNPHNATKENAVADPSAPIAQPASQIALTALQRSEEAKNFVFPRRVAIPTLTRYSVGMQYGPHSDAAFMPLGPEPLRADVSCTMFISNPTDYEGGELVIYQGTELLRIKCLAGSAVFYPSTTLHQVVPVKSGERLVMITFIESQIPDQMHRHLLYTLGEVRALEGLKMDWRNRTQMEFVITNLHRMWSR